MQAFLFLILLSTISSSLALPAQSPAAPDLGTGFPQCFAQDPSTDESWRNDCVELFEMFVESGGPDVLVFGFGGVPVPYIYRGPARQVPYQCEMRIDLLNNAPSETIEKLDVLSDGVTILYVCVGGFLTPGGPLGGSLRGSGRGRNLYIALGKIPVPGPDVGNATSVEQPGVDVT